MKNEQIKYLYYFKLRFNRNQDSKKLRKSFGDDFYFPEKV